MPFRQRGRADRRIPARHARRPGGTPTTTTRMRSRSGSAETATPACAAQCCSVTPGTRCGSTRTGWREAAGRLKAIADELGRPVPALAPRIAMRGSRRAGHPADRLPGVGTHRPDHRRPRRDPSASARRRWCWTRSTGTLTEIRQPETRLADPCGRGRVPEIPGGPMTSDDEKFLRRAVEIASHGGGFGRQRAVRLVAGRRGRHGPDRGPQQGGLRRGHHRPSGTEAGPLGRSGARPRRGAGAT